jgi:hypothetical protein
LDGINYTNVSGGSGATSASYTTPTITATTYYKATDSAGQNRCAVVSYLIKYVNPTLASITPRTSTKCSGNTYTFTAVAQTSGTVNWYNPSLTSSTNGVLVTPALSSTKTYFVSNSIGTCEGKRDTAFAIVKASADAITLSTSAQTVCNNGRAAISVTSTSSNYTLYSWTPATNLFTDVDATTPYVAGTSALTVYAKTSTAGTTAYTVNASNISTSC